MRLHRLSIQAFGPFAGVEEVDFDALSEAGLFLLHGPTGAGKTSVLDAVCFALYGQVPGQRPVDRLRSDHAGTGLAPEVGCEFSVGERRVEVIRSPAWDRPKRRGQGTTREQARVAVRELVDGTWQPRTQRLDEAGLLLTDLLGMGPDSFTKLVLLPQGDFAAFLRADAEARRALLERLFGTDRFTAVQDWLKERRAQARHAVDAAHARTERLLARAAQASAPVLAGPGVAPALAPAPRGPGPEPEPEPGAEQEAEAEHEPTTVIGALRAAVSWARDDAVARRAVTQAGRTRAEAGLALGQARSSAAAERNRLFAQRAALQERAADHAEATSRLLDHERAAALVPLVAPLGAAQAGLDQAHRALSDVLRAGGPAVASDDDAAKVVARARGDLGALAAVAAQELELPPLRRDLAGRRSAAEAVTERASAMQRRLADALGESARAGAQLGSARTAAAGLDAARAAVERSASVEAAVLERDRRRNALERVSARRQSARQDRDDARERWLDLRERRLTGIAAELATELAPGEACRVCGSTEHPAPARTGADPVTAQQERRAQVAAEAAAARLAEIELELAGEQAAFDAAASAAQDLDTGAAARDGDQARAAFDEACRAARDVQHLEPLVHELDAAAAVAREELDDLRESQVRAEEVAHAAQQRLAAAEAAVRAGCGEDDSVAARRLRLEGELGAAEAVRAARGRLAQATGQLAALLAAAAAAAAAAGFAGVDEGVRAVLTPPEHERLTTQTRQYELLVAAAEAGLARQDVAAAAAHPVPDVAALRAAAELAVADDEAAAERETLCRTAAEALGGIAADLREHLATSRPITSAYRRLDDLARCADGTGGENARRMSLSAFVLAARLEQVAQAASVRLSQMSSGRYTLAHSDEVEKGGRRSGLSLHVVDGWTGRRRATTTLSGGETFYTSLALALGLADVLSAEAAGTSIDTLFVDEGFGSLDDDTLDEVMDTLDALRCGGRAVGLVSHVTDLQQRIPTRLEVVKRRDGSTLRSSIAT